MFLCETHAASSGNDGGGGDGDGGLARRVARRLATNPVLAGIVIGIALSVATAGEALKDAEAQDETSDVRYLAFIPTAASWFGQCVTPLGMFITGAWAADRYCGDGDAREWRGTTSNARIVCVFVTLLAKVVVVPAVAFGLAEAVGNLSRDERNGLVLIAALPISVASVVMTERYRAPTDLVASQVVLGTALLLPVALAWCEVLKV